MKKSLVQLALNQFMHGNTSETQKPGFQTPNSLLTISNTCIVRLTDDNFSNHPQIFFAKNQLFICAKNVNKSNLLYSSSSCLFTKHNISQNKHVKRGVRANEYQDAQVESLYMYTLFRNKRFALNEMFQRNATKFAIF